MMKIRLFYSHDDKFLAEGLGSRMAVNGVTVEGREILPDWTPSQIGRDDAPARVTHIVTVFSKSPLTASWFSFAAGYSQGSHLPLICYGLNREYRDLPGIVISNETALFAYLNREYQEWNSDMRIRQAKERILEIGIPFNSDSFHHCVSSKNSAAVPLFLDAGFSPNEQDSSGVPLLNLAARAGDRDMVKILLDAGADVDQRAQDRGGSALLDAALGKQADILEDLITAGANVNIKSKDGQSALIISVGNNDTAVTEMLLAAGADPDAPDSLGASARKYADLFHQDAITRLFQHHVPHE